MIILFRKIRQKLLEQNRVSKYLLYAAGEIILVVIGILIALQINNWNEDRKDAAKATNYLERTSEDLDRSIKRSTSLLKQNKAILTAITQTQMLLENTKSITQKDKEIIDYTLLWCSRSTYQIPNMITYEEMKSNGDLRLIQNLELRNDLASFHNYTNQVKDVYQKLSNDIEVQFEIFNKYIRSYTNPDTLEITFSFDFNKMRQDELFINTFSRLAIHWRAFVYFMDNVNTKSKTLKTKIDIELNK